MANHHATKVDLDSAAGALAPTNDQPRAPSAIVAVPLRSQKVSLGTEYTPPHLRTKKDSTALAMVSHQRDINELVYPQDRTQSNVKNRRVSTGEPSATVSADPSNVNNPLVTDGNVDDASNCIPMMVVQREPTPPLSPKPTSVQVETNLESLSLKNGESVSSFKPRFIAELPKLPDVTLSMIPSNPVTFAPDFLRNNLGGILWSPGYVFVPPPQMSILPGRAYFTVDATHDPYLPSGPGQHGAKLVPFFNIAPEDNDAFNLPDDFSSSVAIPLFMLRDVADNFGRIRKRYVYYGHYNQSRWSDRLDYDNMTKCVPPSIREFWARELSVVGRPEWVTKALQKHFFPPPEYTGTLPGYLEYEGGSVKDGDFAAREEEVTKDLKRHVEKLRRWKKESDMRTSMIRKDWILAAFDKADADGHKALRLWWEYLECVDYRVDFYNMLVTLQSRNTHYI